MTKLRLSLALAFTASTFTAQASLAAPVLAFPEADGYGKYTVGGRGGKVYVVTSLEDEADNPQPGTLRHAIEQEGPRIITFAVSGVIDLKDKLTVRDDYITIAGQTSPHGIVLRGDAFIVKASQVVVRYMRFRLGSTDKNVDAASGKGERDIIFDHCSFSWSIDEVASFYNNVNFTLQYSIVAQSLNQASHAKGDHGYGGIWGGAGASFHHNVIAHNMSRNPRIAGHRLKAPYAKHFELTDIVNNVVYNWGSNSAYGGEDGRFNFIGNTYIAGPASKTLRVFQHYRNNKIEQYGQGYFSDNQLLNTMNESIAPEITIKGVKKPNQEQWDSVTLQSALTAELSPFFAGDSLFRKIDHPAESYATLILNKEVGANRSSLSFSTPKLDSVDQGILQDIQQRTAKHGNRGIINSEHEVIVSWENYSTEFSHSLTAKQQDTLRDKDLDGMPDYWEKSHKLTDPAAYDLNNTYTNIEVYLNQLGQF